MLLNPIWFILQPIDFEHKQYILLDYLQKVEKGFKLNNLADYLFETRYHAKNIECFNTIRSLVELRDVPSPTDEQRAYFKSIATKPDSDPELVEALRISKWALKKLQETIKAGSKVFKRIESNLRMYPLGQPMDKNTGYLLLRYAGSDVCECYKFIYDTTFKEVSFTLFKYYEMPGKMDFLDVKQEVLIEEFKANDFFVAVESDLSFDTRKSVFPVLNQLFPAKIYNKNILGLSL